MPDIDAGAYVDGVNTAWWLHMILGPAVTSELPLSAAIVASAHMIETSHPAFAAELRTSPSHNLSALSVFVVTLGGALESYGSEAAIGCSHGEPANLDALSPSEEIRC